MSANQKRINDLEKQIKFLQEFIVMQNETLKTMISHITHGQHVHDNNRTPHDVKHHELNICDIEAASKILEEKPSLLNPSKVSEEKSSVLNASSFIRRRVIA